MHSNLNILMAQINLKVGAIDANEKKIIKLIQTHQDTHDVILFPELTLTGYPPEDLLYHRDFHRSVEESLLRIQAVVKDCYVLIGHPVLENEQCYNSMSILHDGKKIKAYHKQNLPNYDVFDEARYFVPGKKDPCLLKVKNYTLGICICEDLWQPGPVEDLIEAGACAILSLNASPFHYEKYTIREELLKSYAQKGVAMIYVNQISGQDELLFDGQSMAFDNKGTLCARLPAFEEQLCTLEFNKNQLQGQITPLLSMEALMYKALVFGTREYVEKNAFPGVLLGLSGGIDSALVLCIAVDALGADKVQAVMMPSRFTAPMSTEDALKQVETLKVTYTNLSIEPALNSLLSTLEPVFAGLPADTTEENIQARIRGLLLMALSNKSGNMVLTTSNKSESAVGYATLYGDMAGGYAVLKDVLKTQVYALAHYRNSLNEVIPQRVITRAPSAELKDNQRDQDNLPEYSVVDAVLTAYMEQKLSTEEITAMGFNAEEVKKIIHLLKHNEYKRRQSAPGIKISPIAFGKDWRYPITCGF